MIIMNLNNNNNFRSNYYNDDVEIENINQTSGNLRINMQGAPVNQNNRINEISSNYKNTSNQETFGNPQKKKKK